MESVILIIDDDVKLQKLLKEYLEPFGYKTFAHASGEAVQEAVQASKPDIIILDIMLPVHDGFSVLQQLRKTTTIPVIMLTAKGEDTDKIIGLEMGADDYLPKPFNPRELLARIKAILRRSEKSPEQNTITETTQPTTVLPDYMLECAGLILDRQSFYLFIGDDRYELSTTEFRILEALMEKPGVTLSRDELMNKGRGRDHLAFDRSVDVFIRKIRSKLEVHPEHKNRIKTIWGTGYMLINKIEDNL